MTFDLNSFQQFILRTILFVFSVFLGITALYLFSNIIQPQNYEIIQKKFAGIFFLLFFAAGILFFFDRDRFESSHFPFPRRFLFLLLMTSIPMVILKIIVLFN